MRVLKSEGGQLVVWLAGIIPVLVVVLTFLVNLVLLVDAKIRMQAAVDRGAYAGASYLSYAMNEIAGRNWEFRKKYLEKKKTFETYPDDREVQIKKQIKELNDNQGKLYDRMKRLLESGYRTAFEIGQDVALKNLEGMPHLAGVGYVPVYGIPGDLMFRMGNDCPDGINCINKDTLLPYEIVDNDYDPTTYESYPNVVHMYLIKSGDFVALAGEVRAFFMPPLLSRFFAGPDGGFPLRAFAAAQPYGGSIKYFSFVDAENVEEASSSEKGRGLLYHPAFIPIKSVVGGIDAEH